MTLYVTVLTFLIALAVGFLGEVLIGRIYP